MNTEWLSFLTESGALIDGELVTFGAPHDGTLALDERTTIADLSHLGLIAVSGTGAETLLQGQFTNDVYQVAEDRAQLSAWCSPKGRVLSSFLVFRRASLLYIQLPSTLLDTIVKRLKMFILRADVGVTNASDELIRIGLSGPDASTELAKIYGRPPPSEIYAATQFDDTTVIRLRGTTLRYQIVAPQQTMTALWRKLSASASAIGHNAWALLDIRAGVATVHPETSDEFTPQMLNLDAIDGISFSKGCYAGQEIVARTQYLGRLKRRTYLARVTCDVLPEAGDTLYHSIGQDAQPVGRILDAQWDSGGCVLLAVIQVDAAETSAIHLECEPGPPLQIVPLPYTLS